VKNSLLVVLVLSLMSVGLVAEDWITIYNDDLSLVRSQMDLELQEGRQEYNYSDITSRINAASVIVSSLNNQIRVAEQNYEYDLAGKAQIMAKYIDKEVTMLTKNQATVYSGIMKFYDGSSIGLLESGTNRLLILSEAEVEVIQLAELPSNFYTRPTLHWSLIAPRAARYPLQLTYLSGGFSWDVAYNAVWNGEKLALNSWVTIRNYSGRAFNNVNLKLVAGDINRVSNVYKSYDEMTLDRATMAGGMAAPSFEERAFHDFHLYSLDQKVSFANNQTKQLELYPLQNVNARSEYAYYVHSNSVLSNIIFRNTEAEGLGKPLPKGIFTIYRADVDGNLELIGEDSIEHTSRNEEVTLTTGKAFDLVASTVVRDARSISQRVSERTIQVTLRNNSEEAKSIKVYHQLNANSRIVESQRPYEVNNELKATIPIQIAAGEEIIFTFRERSEY
jgi:hypothetical protein